MYTHGFKHFWKEVWNACMEKIFEFLIKNEHAWKNRAERKKKQKKNSLWINPNLDFQKKKLKCPAKL